MRFEDAYSEFKPIRAGVPQGSVLSPLLYSLFTADIPKPKGNSIMGVFADDTSVLTSASRYEDTVEVLQGSLDDIQNWAGADGTKLNATKSENVVFTFRNYVQVPLVVDRKAIPHVDKARYLGLIMDAKLKYKEHILTKKEQIKLKCKKMNWLIGKHSKLSLKNKILLYKTMIRPVWAYACQLWACSANSNIREIETIQNIALRKIAQARWYERNVDIRTELGIESLEVFISRMYERYAERLESHPNTEAIKLLDWVGETRRLKRRKPHELHTPDFKKV